MDIGYIYIHGSDLDPRGNKKSGYIRNFRKQGIYQESGEGYGYINERGMMHILNFFK